MKNTNRKFSKTAICFMLSAIIISGSIVPTIAANLVGLTGYITIEAAQQIAAEKAPSAIVTGTELDVGKKGAKYEIKLQDDIYKYEVDINAVTGIITGFEQKTVKQKNVYDSFADSSAYISLENAQAIVLNYIGADFNDAHFIKTKIDRKKGTVVYDVKLIANNMRYEFRIDALSGTIIKQKQKAIIIETSYVNNAEGYIGADIAKITAFNHAGLYESDVIFNKLKTDWEDGIIVYDIEFFSNGKKYEYGINAISDAIVEFDIEL